jgi:hypothetical protein
LGKYALCVLHCPFPCVLVDGQVPLGVVPSPQWRAFRKMVAAKSVSRGAGLACVGQVTYVRSTTSVLVAVDLASVLWQARKRPGPRKRAAAAATTEAGLGQEGPTAPAPAPAPPTAPPTPTPTAPPTPTPKVTKKRKAGAAARGSGKRGRGDGDVEEGGGVSESKGDDSDSDVEQFPVTISHLLFGFTDKHLVRMGGCPRHGSWRWWCCGLLTCVGGDGELEGGGGGGRG